MTRTPLVLSLTFLLMGAHALASPPAPQGPAPRMGVKEQRRLELARRRAAAPHVAREAPEPDAAGPDLRLLAVTVIGGNGDGWIQPGELVTVRVTLSNFGNSPATNVYGQLNVADGNPHVTLVDKTASWDTIPAHGSGTSVYPFFQIQTTSLLPCGSRLALDLEVLADGYAATVPVILDLSRNYFVDTVADAARRYNESDTVVNGPGLGLGGGDYLGFAVASGDVNGDGFDDLVIGSILGDGPGRVDSGEVWVIYGSPTGLAPAIDTAAPPAGVSVIYGRDAGDYLGGSVAAGDLNGDGFDDVLMGAPFADGPTNGEAAAGEAWVLYGGSSGLGAIVDLAVPPASSTVAYGPDAGDSFGSSIAAGDVDGDGLDDLLVGSPQAGGPGNTRPGAGEAWLLYGRVPQMAGSIDLSAPPASAAVVHGPDASDNLGVSAAAGDVDGDGVDDLVLGAYFADGQYNEKSSAGDVWVVYGRQAQLPAATDLASPPTDAAVIHGPDTFDHLGNGVAAADLDGDGIEEIVAAASTADGPGNTRTSAGEVWVLRGEPTRLPARTNLFNPPATASVAYGARAGCQLGGGFNTPGVGGGDVNGDGYDDLLAAAPLGDGPPSVPRGDAGEAWVLFGAPSGLPGSIDLNVSTGRARAVYGADAGDQMGSAIAAGDVDGDGLADVIVGASLADSVGNGRANAGEVHVLNGTATTTFWTRGETPSFIDASGGTNLGLSCDDCSTSIPIGFPFTFHGETFTTLHVSANGFVAFAPINDLASASPRCIDSQGPAATSSLPLLVAPFWDDLDLRGAGAVFAKLDGLAPARRLTVEWLNVPHYPGTGAATFEVSLFESTGQILFQYEDLAFGNAAWDHGAASVVGVQNRTGAVGTAYNCAQGLLAALPAAVSFNPSTPLWQDNLEAVDTAAAPAKPGMWTMSGSWRSLTASCPGQLWHTAGRSLYGAAGCTYANSQTDVLGAPAIDTFPADGRVTFWQRFASEAGFDVGTVTATGGPGTVLLSQSGLAGGGVFHQPGPYFLGAPYAGATMGLTFGFVADGSITDTGWMVDDVQIVGCNATGISALVNPVAYAGTTIYCGDGTQGATLDAVGSACGDGSAPTGYQWLEDGTPIPGAQGVTYAIPTAHAPGTFAFQVVVTCQGGAATSAPVFVTIVAPPEAVGNTLRLAKVAAGASMKATWTDVGGAADYVLYSDVLPGGPFATVAGTAGTGLTGITLPIPVPDLVCYRVAGRNPTCGVGPR